MKDVWLLKHVGVKLQYKFKVDYRIELPIFLFLCRYPKHVEVSLLEQDATRHKALSTRVDAGGLYGSSISYQYFSVGTGFSPSLSISIYKNVRRQFILRNSKGKESSLTSSFGRGYSEVIFSTVVVALDFLTYCLVCIDGRFCRSPLRNCKHLGLKTR
jgi:hypothetical protein